MIKRDRLEAALLNKGFAHDADKAPDHIWFRLYDGTKKTAVTTKVSRGSSHKDLSDPIVSAIARQIGLTKKELGSYVACTLSAADYLSLMRSREKI